MMHLLEWMEYLIRVERTGRIDTGPDFDNRGAVKRLDGYRAELTEIGRELLVVLTERLHMEQRITALEADLAAALDELAKHQPAERVWKCWCADGFRWGEYGTGMLSDFVVAPAGLPDGVQPRWCSPVQDEHVCTYCPDCGAHLGADGVARRNADTARVQRVREALLMPLVVPSWTVDSETFELRDCFRDVRLSEFADAIRAALDGGAKSDE